MAAQLRLFKCLNPDCTAEEKVFEAEHAVCPACSAGRDDPRAVMALVYIHYLVNVPVAKAPIKTSSGGRMIACRPFKNVMPTHCSGVTVAVNCPRCKATEIFKQHEANEVDQHLPFVEDTKDGKETTVTNASKTG